MAIIREIATTAIRFLRHHKEEIQNISGVATFAIGLFAAHDLYQVCCGRPISTENPKTATCWQETALKVILLSAKLSLALSAATSRPGVWTIGSLALSLFTPQQLEAVFGPNTIFALNPWHPRHVVSILAACLALPTVGQSLYRGFRREPSPPSDVLMTDSRVRTLTCLVFLTSRPTFHLGNALVRRWWI